MTPTTSEQEARELPCPRCGHPDTRFGCPRCGSPGAALTRQEAQQGAQGAVALPPMQAPVPTVAEARERIDGALSDAQKALAVLSTMLKKANLMQGYAVADEILGNLGFARKLHAALTTPPVDVHGLKHVGWFSTHSDGHLGWLDHLGDPREVHDNGKPYHKAYIIEGQDA